ncbi:MAG: substrate-binding domain-containing protein, partial [Planctomycetota bacterium]
MKTVARALVWLAVVVASVGVGVYVSRAPAIDPSANKPAKPGSYVFVAGGSDPYWQLCIAGAKTAADDIGAELKVLRPTGEGEDGLLEQLAWLGEVDPSACNGLAIGPIDPVRQTTPINAAADKVTIVTVDSDAPQSRRLCYIGSSNYEAGMMAGRMVKQAAPGGGKVAVLVASLAKTNAAARVEGLRDELAADPDAAAPATDANAEADAESEGNAGGHQVLDLVFDLGDPARCAERLREVLQQHPDVVAVVGTFGYHGPIALEELAKLAGPTPAIIAFDEEERTLAGVEDGRVYATIAQDPFMFGAEAIRMLDKVYQGDFLEMPIARQVDVGVHCIVVKQDNLEDFRKDLAERQALATSV